MKVEQIMTKKVLALKPSDSLYSCITKFAKNKISGAPVVSRGNRVIGGVSDRDVAKALNTFTPDIRLSDSSLIKLLFATLRSKKEDEQILEELKQAKKIRVASFMSEPAVVNTDASVMNVVAMMSQDDVTRVCVVDKKGKLAGIVARTDVIRSLSRALK